MPTDPRRQIPRTDELLRAPAFADAVARYGRDRVKAAVNAAQERARAGGLAPERVAAVALAQLQRPSSSLTPVLNATGVVVHTNVGRAPLSAAAREAVVAAAGYVDLELDLDTGRRSRRGLGAEAEIRRAVPDAEAAMIVNNGAAALVLATTALAAGREVIISRGELVEIGDGFRIAELVASTGAVLREVGSTNRTHAADYAAAVSDRTGCILKVHPSNFRVEGFTHAAGVAELQGLARPDGTAVPVVVDVGSGLLAPDSRLPDEPDVASALRAGADLVTASADKLLGGPQAGLIVGRRETIERLRRFPLARALRVDKLTLAALEATLSADEPPVARYRRLSAESLRARTERVAAALGGEVVEHDGRIGGGGAPGVALPGLAIRLSPARPDAVARALRLSEPAVLPRVSEGALLVDLRCIEAADDDALIAAVRAVTSQAAQAAHGEEGAR